jgi:[protein-PII] uridylyltransferase
MLLHDLGDPAEAAASLFRPLWDAKLRVGHSVRTVREAASAAKERFDTQTTLLTSRLVAGSREMFDSLKSDVAAVTRARPLRRYLVEEEKGRRAQTPYLLMATDVKTGRGGLRTLHGFDWERRRQELIGRFSPDFQPEEAEARETLIRIRNALHVAAGRSHDVFSVDLREQAARWLGSDVFEVAGSLVAALQVVDRLATQRWPEVVETARRDLGERKWFRLTGRSRPGPAETPGSEELVWMLQTGRTWSARLRATLGRRASRRGPA